MAKTAGEERRTARAGDRRVEGGKEGREKRGKEGREEGRKGRDNIDESKWTRTEIDPSTDFRRSSTVPSTLLYSSCSRAAIRSSEESSWDWSLRMVLEM